MGKPKRRVAGWRWIFGIVLAVAIVAAVARVIGASWEGTAWRVLGLLMVCVVGGAINEAVYSFLAWRRDDGPPRDPGRPE